MLKLYYIFWILLISFDFWCLFRLRRPPGPGGLTTSGPCTPVPRLGIDKPPLTSAIEAKRSARNRILASLGGRPHGRSKSLCRFGELFPRVPTTLYLAVHVFKCFSSTGIMLYLSHSRVRTLICFPGTLFASRSGEFMMSGCSKFILAKFGIASMDQANQNI